MTELPAQEIETRERPILFQGDMVRALLDGSKTQTRRVVKGMALEWLQPGGFTPGYVAMPENSLCPYGQAGDRLWVRETHGFGGDAYAPDTYYRATNPDAPIQGRWHPSIHMRRADSRITLEITEVHVERLQDISEADAQAEGVIACDGWLDDVALCFRAKAMGIPATESRVWYAELWEKINGTGSWEANPWVWCVSFRRIENV